MDRGGSLSRRSRLLHLGAVYSRPELERYCHFERGTRTDSARTISVGSPSDLHRPARDDNRHRAGFRTHHWIRRRIARLRQFLDQARPRRESSPQTISRAVPGLSTALETHHSLCSLATRVSVTRQPGSENSALRTHPKRNSPPIQTSD